MTAGFTDIACFQKMAILISSREDNAPFCGEKTAPEFGFDLAAFEGFDCILVCNLSCAPDLPRSRAGHESYVQENQ
jgi:hypothetical protein